jgi:hypothetical protein
MIAELITIGLNEQNVICHNKAKAYFNLFIMTKNNPIAG